MSEIRNGRGEQELFDWGFRETDNSCPECGKFVWQYDQMIDVGFDGDDESVLQSEQECPFCGWWSITHDA